MLTSNENLDCGYKNFVSFFFFLHLDTHLFCFHLHTMYFNYVIRWRLSMTINSSISPNIKQQKFTFIAFHKINSLFMYIKIAFFCFIFPLLSLGGSATPWQLKMTISFCLSCISFLLLEVHSLWGLERERGISECVRRRNV